MSELKRHAAEAAQRVDPQVAQMNPIIIGIIFDQIIPILIGCLRGWLEKPSPAEMQALVAREYQRNPDGVLRKTARRIRGESDVPMTKDQSRVLAKAAIQQMIESPATEVTSAATEALESFDANQ